MVTKIRIKGLGRLCALLAFVYAASLSVAFAQTLTTLYSFQDLTQGGEVPLTGLVQASNGLFYGTTSEGGATGTAGYGTVYSITTAGVVATLHDFVNTDGAMPSTLIQGTNGVFYGTTAYGGLGVCGDVGCGTVFSITPSGTFATLYNFCLQTSCPDGNFPLAGLVQGTDGNLYGTTSAGGSSGSGTAFQITTGGVLTTLHSFNGGDGSNPASGLIQATDGNFYGTTRSQGANGSGTVYAITSSGTLTALHSFHRTDGAVAQGLIQGKDGKLYGVTQGGGSNNSPFCQAFGCGTLYSITTAGTFKTLYNFCGQSNCADGNSPGTNLVQGTDGVLYGVAGRGGQLSCAGVGCGTVFKVTTAGVFTVLHTFAGTDGRNPVAGLIQGTNGSFYGTTAAGASNAVGSVFSLAAGLGPFVETNPTSGTVGTPVTILGSSLAGATKVTFNGTQATILKVTNSSISTSVPSGATTGKVQVTIPKGTLNSNIVFQVRTQ